MPKIKLSKIAEVVMSQTIKESEIPPGKGFRLKEFESGLTLEIDSPSKGDRVVKKGDNLIFIVDRKLEKQVGNATIDISHFKKDAKLVILRHEKGEEVSFENWKGD